RGVGGEPVVLPEVVLGTLLLCRARLGYHVHEPARRAPELGRSPARGDYDLLHRIEVERERRPLAAALLAEERIVEVRPVHRDVVVDAALAGDRQLVAIWPLQIGRAAGRAQG